jgi:hypothetical protein
MLIDFALPLGPGSDPAVMPSGDAVFTLQRGEMGFKLVAEFSSLWE